MCVNVYVYMCVYVCVCVCMCVCVCVCVCVCDLQTSATILYNDICHSSATVMLVTAISVQTTIYNCILVYCSCSVVLDVVSCIRYVVANIYNPEDTDSKYHPNDITCLTECAALPCLI